MGVLCLACLKFGSGNVASVALDEKVHMLCLNRSIPKQNYCKALENTVPLAPQYSLNVELHFPSYNYSYVDVIQENIQD